MSNTPARIDRLRKAVALIDGERAAGTMPGTLCDMLIDLGFVRQLNVWQNTLRYCSVTGSCTWSSDHGLIASWHAAAGRELAKIEARR